MANDEWKFPAMGDYMLQALYVPAETVKRLASVEEADMVRPTPTLQLDIAYVAGAAAASLREQDPPLPDSGPQWAIVKKSKLEELEMELLSARAVFTNLNHRISQLKQDNDFDWFLRWQTWTAAAVLVLAGFLLSGVF